MTHEELEQIISNWEKTNLIENFDEKSSIALCLQSQLEFNKTTQVDDAAFKRISIPLVVRVFSESKAFQNNIFVNYFESKRPEYLFFASKPTYEFTSLEEEAKFVSELANEIRSEIDRVFEDRRGAEVIFHGFGKMVDGTVFMAYN